MQYVRLGIVFLICVCLAGIGRAETDEEKKEEQAEHETAKAVLAKATIDVTKAIETALEKIPSGKPIYVAPGKGSKVAAMGRISAGRK